MTELIDIMQHPLQSLEVRTITQERVVNRLLGAPSNLPQSIGKLYIGVKGKFAEGTAFCHPQAIQRYYPDTIICLTTYHCVVNILDKPKTYYTMFSDLSEKNI